MKVKELIKKLQALDEQEQQVWLPYPSGIGECKEVDEIESALHHWDHHKIYILK